MKKQKLTDRMKIRIKSFIATKNALLPGFCEGMVCDQTCPLHSNLPGNEPCSWQKTYQTIDRMELALLKDKKE